MCPGSNGLVILIPHSVTGTTCPELWGFFCVVSEQFKWKITEQDVGHTSPDDMAMVMGV